MGCSHIASCHVEHASAIKESCQGPLQWSMTYLITPATLQKDVMSLLLQHEACAKCLWACLLVHTKCCTQAITLHPLGKQPAQCRHALLHCGAPFEITDMSIDTTVSECCCAMNSCENVLSKCGYSVQALYSQLIVLGISFKHCTQRLCSCKDFPACALPTKHFHLGSVDRPTVHQVKHGFTSFQVGTYSLYFVRHLSMCTSQKHICWVRPQVHQAQCPVSCNGRKSILRRRVNHVPNFPAPAPLIASSSLQRFKKFCFRGCIPVYHVQYLPMDLSFMNVSDPLLIELNFQPP